MDRPGRRSGLTRLLLAVVPQVLLVLVGAWLNASIRNSLERNGRWIPTKVGLHRVVIGSLPFATSYKTLSNEELDLGRWFGHQEVLYGEALPLAEVAFDFLLAENAYLLFVFNRTETGFDGVRLGTNELFPDAVFTAGPDGEFLTRAPLDVSHLSAETWMELRVKFDDDAFSVALDGKPLGRYPARLEEPQVFGVRNGQEKVLVDRVQIRLRSGEEIIEEFANRGDLARGVAVGLILVALVNGGILFLVRSRGWSARNVMAALGAAAVGLLVSSLLFLFYEIRFAKSYPRTDGGVEFDWKREQAEIVSRAIRDRYGEPAAHGTVRVLVVGGSQTWGAGAARDGESFVDVLERRLNDPANRAANDSRQFECINGGVSGLFGSWLFEYYRDSWIDLGPDILVLNLSNNETDAGDFSAALEDFVRLNAERGITTLFSLEANSIEKTPGDLPMHATMRAVAEKHDIPVVDTHAYLKERHDSGLLWWDFVHPTSYGHRLIGDALAPAVRSLAQK